MKLPSKNFDIIENFLDLDFCNSVIDYVINNVEEDPREFYGTLGLGGKHDFFDENNIRYREYDPDKFLDNTIKFGYDFFIKNYPIEGNFELNRAHVNFMFTGAELHSHKDDRNHDEPIETLGSRTHVMGIFLNDDYEGGELVFPEQDIVLKPKAGSLVFFPGYYTRHGVNKVLSGTRINILAHYFDIIDKDKINPNYTL